MYMYLRQWILRKPNMEVLHAMDKFPRGTPIVQRNHEFQLVATHAISDGASYAVTRGPLSSGFSQG